jgi:hypothetical protein
MVSADITYQPNLSEIFGLPVAVELRSATDLARQSNALEHFLKFILAEQERVGKKSWGAAFQSTEKVDTKDALFPAAMSPWLVDTIQIIDTRKKALSTIDTGSNAEQRKMLDTAEMLASFLADIAARRRPQINIDEEGRSSFASVLDDFYFHLTVDAPGKLTWFARVNGVEYFDEGVAFEGRSFPPQLRQIFAA